MGSTLNKNVKLYNIRFLLKLLSSALNHTPSPNVEADIDFDYIFKFAKIHHVANTAFYSIERLNTKPQKELLEKWEQLRNQNIHKNIIQTMEFDAIKKVLSQNNIEFMPFKGFDISKLYPSPDYRAMSDLDVLIKSDFAKAINLVKKMGYTDGGQDTTNEKTLFKPPFMTLEFHSDLVNINSPYYKYYKNIFSKTNTNNNFEHKMSNEDFYIYNLVHLHKHYTISGFGLRNIMDLYVINKNLFPKLNSLYVFNELEKLDLLKFYKQMSFIAEKWFSGREYDSFSTQELYIFSSGAYGTKENHISNAKTGKSKISYVFFRLFPPLKWMQNFYKPLVKFPILLPFFYCYRLFYDLFHKKDKIKSEIKQLTNSKDT